MRGKLHVIFVLRVSFFSFSTSECQCCPFLCEKSSDCLLLADACIYIVPYNTYNIYNINNTVKENDTKIHNALIFISLFNSLALC